MFVLSMRDRASTHCRNLLCLVVDAEVTQSEAKAREALERGDSQPSVCNCVRKARAKPLAHLGSSR